MTTAGRHPALDVRLVRAHELSPIKGGPAPDGGFNIALFEDNQTLTKINVSREQMQQLARLAAYLVRPPQEADASQMAIEPFENENNPQGCALLLALNQHSTLLEGVCYSMRDRIEKVQGALLQAHTEERPVPPCSCGNCPEPVIAHWQGLFGE